MSLRILMVEDNAMNSELAEMLLVARGHHVTVAASAQELRELLKVSAIPDIVLMDILLGDGDGVELLQELRQLRAYDGVPVVALTAHALTGDGPRLLAAGFSAVLTKPIDTRGFAAEVARLARR